MRLRPRLTGALHAHVLMVVLSFAFVDFLFPQICLRHRRLGDESSWEIVSFRFVWFRSCRCAGTRSGCLVEFETKRWGPPFTFSLLGRRAFPFPLCVKCMCTKFIKCVKCIKCCSPTLQTSYPTSVGFIGIGFQLQYDRESGP